MHSSSPQTPVIKSWLGAALALFFASLQIYSWLDTQNLSNLLSLFGFLCFVYPWSQLHRPLAVFSRNHHQTMNRWGAALSWVGFMLLIAATALMLLR